MGRPHQDLVGEFRRYSKLVSKQNKLMGSGMLSSIDINFVYEIAFLSAFTSFEVFVERQFEALLCGRPYYKNRPVHRRITVRSEMVARDAIRGANAYPKYLPVNNLEHLAKIFFRGGRPFTLLTHSDKDSLTKCQTIRNCIAHRTRASKQKFERQVLSGVTLRPNQRNPAGYLRSQITIGRDRFEQIISDLARISSVFVS